MEKSSRARSFGKCPVRRPARMISSASPNVTAVMTPPPRQLHREEQLLVRLRINEYIAAYEWEEAAATGAAAIKRGPPSASFFAPPAAFLRPGWLAVFPRSTRSRRSSAHRASQRTKFATACSPSKPRAMRTSMNSPAASRRRSKARAARRPASRCSMRRWASPTRRLARISSSSLSSASPCAPPLARRTRRAAPKPFRSSAHSQRRRHRRRASASARSS